MDELFVNVLNGSAKNQYLAFVLGAISHQLRTNRDQKNKTAYC